MADKRWAVLDSSNVVIDLMIWDGKTETWTPPSDMIYVEIPDNDRMGIGMTYNKDGSGTGTESSNKWIVPPEQVMDGSNWDKNGKGSDDMYE